MIGALGRTVGRPMTRGWRMLAIGASVLVFIAVLLDPTPDPVPFLAGVPTVLLALGWAVLAFAWVTLVAGLAHGFCWLRGEAACRIPRD